MPHTDWFHAQLRELPHEQCLELVRSKSVGRLAYSGTDGLEVLPLNYVVHDGAIIFRTSPYTALGRQGHVDEAAFEVDEIDDYTESGWSVLLKGRLRRVDGDELPDSLDRPQPWPAGERFLYMRLVPRAVSGRQLFPA
jgi:uncharacterized protein